MKHMIPSGLLMAASFSLLVACGPSPNQTEPSPNPSVAPSASVAPSVAPTESPSTSPSTDPSVAPTESPSAPPSTEPGASASPSTPLPSATSDISVIETTTFNGKVYDDTNAPLDGVSITAKSLNSSVPFEATTTTAGGTYSFNNAPSGVQIEIVASRSGFTTRRRVEVLKSNKQGDPNANKYDFGTDGSEGSGSEANALSDKPEVVMVTPGRNASGIDPKSSFVLKFSEPMDRNSVEDAFSVHVYEDQQLSVHNANNQNTFKRLNNGGFSDAGGGFSSASLVWDESDMTATWNSDDTEVTFTFADEKLLPSDKDSDKVPDYMVSFYAGGAAKTLKDKSGILRRDEWFKLTDGDFENYFKFAIRTDEVKPQVSSVIASSAEGGSLRGDSLKVRFSERMLIDTKAGDVGASNTVGVKALNNDANMNPLNANLYTVVVNPNSSNLVFNWGTAAGSNATPVGGQAVFDADDLTRKTILLTPGTYNGSTVNYKRLPADNTPGMGFTPGLPGTDPDASMTLNILFTDGTSDSETFLFSQNLGNNTYEYAKVAATINTRLGVVSGQFTMTETSNVSGGVPNSIDKDDVYTVALANPTTIDHDNNLATAAKTVKAAYATGELAENMGINGVIFTPGMTVGGTANIFNRSDVIKVTVSSSVVDPAGNTLESRNADKTTTAG